MESISNTLFSLYRGTDLHGPWVTACLQGAWPGLVGEKMAKVCRPVALEGAELGVAVYEESWFPALMSMRQEILERVQSFAGHDVTRLTFLKKTEDKS